MKSRTRLAMQQADMRAAIKNGLRRHTPSPQVNPLFAALVLYHSRGWAEERIARFLRVPKEVAHAWLAAGTPIWNLWNGKAGKPVS